MAGLRSAPVPAGASVVMLPGNSLLLCTHWYQSYDGNVVLQFTSGQGIVIECVHRYGASGSFTPGYNAIVTFLGMSQQDRRCWVSLQGYGSAWAPDGSVIDYACMTWRGEMNQFWASRNHVQRQPLQ